MLKYSSLILLVAVATLWSCADANPRQIPIKRETEATAVEARYTALKRSTEDDDVDEISAETQERIIKELLTSLLILTVDTSAEERALSPKLHEAVEKDWDSLDDFAKHVAQVYEEVTGRSPDEIEDSEESPENAVEA